MIAAASLPNTSRRGAGAWVREKLQQLTAEIDAWEAVSFSTDIG